MNRKGSEEALVAAAAEGLSHAKVAQAASVSVSTVKRRLGEPAIADAIRDFRLRQRQAHAAQLIGANGDAIDRLHALVHHDDPHVALRAIAVIMATTPRLTAVVELEERINSIERNAPNDDATDDQENGDG